MVIFANNWDDGVPFIVVEKRNIAADMDTLVDATLMLDRGNAFNTKLMAAFRKVKVDRNNVGIVYGAIGEAVTYAAVHSI